ncbi:unnamed protein product [Sphagnum balticum]
MTKKQRFNQPAEFVPIVCQPGTAMTVMCNEEAEKEENMVEEDDEFESIVKKNRNVPNKIQGGPIKDDYTVGTLQDKLIEIAKEAFVTVVGADDDQPEDDPELAPDPENEHVMELEVPPVVVAEAVIPTVRPIEVQTMQDGWHPNHDDLM